MGLSWWKRSWTAADFEALATRPATGWRWGSPKGAAVGIGSARSRFPGKPCLFIPSTGGDSLAAEPMETYAECSSSGFFVTGDGYFVTNEHVTGNGEQIRLVTE